MAAHNGTTSRVSVHSKLTAVSSKPVEAGKIHQLSAVDHAMALHSLHVIFYYKKNPFGFFDLDPLRVSLSEVLSLYPPVTGRLKIGEAGNWEVKCNDAGVRVFRAKVGCTLDEWLRSADGAEEKDLTGWEEMPEDPSTWAPFRLQVTEFEGGGVAFGLSCPHIIANLTSVILIFKAWSETHRKETIGQPPLFHTSIPGETSVPKPLTNSFSHYAAKANAEVKPSSEKMATAAFKFSDSTIRQWFNTVGDRCPNATPFDLLASLFWMRIGRLKTPIHDHDHTLSVCLDLRRLVQPPIPLGYFGNALHFSTLSRTRKEMESNELGEVVDLMHQHISSVSKGQVRSAIDWLESQKEEGGKYAAPFRMYGPYLTCVNMEQMITGHQSLLYAASFENNEKPVHVSCHVGNVEGEGLVLVTPLEEGLARMVIVTLPMDELAKLCEDEGILRLEPKLLLHRNER
ncbi:hypothetical protein K2173_017691 [Erythroxylum novogranatense]|uniref:Uncharacterized protein n=1 Tax=Erythroxylum novogranatense TaxID=1862640 RepID=A0AAV8T1P7_9ROSI|nr:hypothetical protein K2173_017691 [Erythroxylum novogranatense]